MIYSVKKIDTNILNLIIGRIKKNFSGKIKKNKKNFKGGQKMIKQCAWCKSLMLDGIRIKNSKQIIAGMSHGICLTCKKDMEMIYKKEKKGIRGTMLAAAV